MIEIRNFKNLAKCEFREDQGLTLLVGPNGSGKSNLIEAVELLSFLIAGNKLHEVTDVGRGGGLEIRGGLSLCPRFGSKEFSFAVSKDLKVGEEETKFLYKLAIRAGRDPRIVEESLYFGEDMALVFETLREKRGSFSPTNSIRYNNHDRGRNKPVVQANAEQSALSQYARLATGDTRLPDTLRLLDAFSASLSPPEVFDPIPNMMRNYERSGDAPLSRNGSNLSAVLHSLKEKQSRLGAKKNGSRPADRILQRISQLPDEAFLDYQFVETAERDVLLGFQTKAGRKGMTAKVLSDGTLRALAILTALESCQPGARLILEEYDNAVHPSRVHLLTEALVEAAERRKLQVLATTHNPATLNALPESCLASVLLMVDDRGKSKAIPIDELPGWIEFIESGRLGDLITRRIYEKHVSPVYESTRSEEIAKWLEAIPA
jgi:predicted ATPase